MIIDVSLSQREVEATGVAPTDNRESAIVATLSPGNYTCVLQSKTGTPGVGLFELYDLDAANSHLANISTRGKVGLGENVVIGGFIIGGDQPTKVLIRAIGPSLAKVGITNALKIPDLNYMGRLVRSFSQMTTGEVHNNSRSRQREFRLQIIEKPRLWLTSSPVTTPPLCADTATPPGSP